MHSPHQTLPSETCAHMLPYFEASSRRHFFLDRCLNIRRSCESRKPFIGVESGLWNASSEQSELCPARKPMVRSEDLAETCILKGHVEVTKAWWLQVVVNLSPSEAFCRSKKARRKTTVTQASLEQAESSHSIRRCRKVAVAGS